MAIVNWRELKSGERWATADRQFLAELGRYTDAHLQSILDDFRHGDPWERDAARAELARRARLER